MHIETIGNFQLRLFAREHPGVGWDPFITVMRFDREKQDFVCEVSDRPAGEARSSYEEAIEAARLAGIAHVRKIA